MVNVDNGEDTKVIIAGVVCVWCVCLGVDGRHVLSADNRNPNVVLWVASKMFLTAAWYTCSRPLARSSLVSILHRSTSFAPTNLSDARSLDRRESSLHAVMHRQLQALMTAPPTISSALHSLALTILQSST